MNNWDLLLCGSESENVPNRTEWAVMVAVNDNMFEIYSYSILIVLHAELHGLF